MFLLTRFRFFVFFLLLALGIAFLRQLPAQAQGEVDPETLALGARLFAENCAVCHGEDGQGRIGATLAKDWPAIGTDLRLHDTIANGVPGSFMPAWSEANDGPLNDEEIDALVALILSGQTGDATLLSDLVTPTPRPPIEPIPDVAGDPNNGAVLYFENCAVCHGKDAKGRIGAPLIKDWPAIRPDLRLQNTISNGVAGSFMPAWSQDNGGPLIEEQIDDLVAFILSIEPSEAPVEATHTPEPTAVPAAGPLTQDNLVILVSGIVLVLIIVGGVVWVTRRS